MNFDDYQVLAEKTAIFENAYYPYASLVIEAAEFADVACKPLLRGDKISDEQEYRNRLKKEAGDVLWNLAVALNRMGISLEEVAVANIEKLQDRKNRGVIMGNGDDR